MEGQQPGPCAVCGKVSNLDDFEKTCSESCSRERASNWRPARIRHLRLAEKQSLVRGQLRVRSRDKCIEGRLVGVIVDSNGFSTAKVLSTEGTILLVGIRELELNISDLKQHEL